jgi:UDP-N-acetylglucosamine acyltransferase
MSEYNINMPEYPRDYFVDYNNNKIHHLARIGSNVVLGKNNHIGAFVNIEGNTIIGDNNKIHPFVSIGSDPEHKVHYGNQNKGLVIGNNNVIREGVKINAGCFRTTEIRNNTWLFSGSYIAHDCIVCDFATISANVSIGGHCIIGIDANLGLGANIHQNSVIGSGSMVGMGCVVTKKSQILPLMTYVGNPARFLKENSFKKDKLSIENANEYALLYIEHLSMNEK